MPIRRNPTIYEINTWPWLAALSKRLKRPVQLSTIPNEIVDELASAHLDAIWLMGVWERSAPARQIALRHPDLQTEYRRALPDLQPEQVVGSPYAVHRYVVDAHLGGPEGLAAFRAQLSQRGISLILDYVPNHVAVDHPWTRECPACFVPGKESDLTDQPGYYFRVEGEAGRPGAIFAHGRDPYFPAWTDTAQIDAFSAEVRRQTQGLLMDIARQCDGVRCDMAMLMVNRVFAHTWGRSRMPTREFWEDVIPTIKQLRPDFIFMAEVYWDMEADLQALGFDYTYDKRLYDRLLHESPVTVRDHLLAVSVFQRRLVRFIENHDEGRAVSAFGLERSMAAATLSATLPGAKLFHEGQFEGHTLKLPVQLGERPAEQPNRAVQTFYRTLLAALAQAPYHEGAFMMLGIHPIVGEDPSHYNLFAWAWALNEDWRMVVVNYSGGPAKGRVFLPRPDFAGSAVWMFQDGFNPAERLLRNGDDLLTSGLPLELPAYGVRLFTMTRT
ncbi:MAG TPA: alpha-amylase family glycosyl hydrolase [Aggregatilineales bacterium]|nr:alpha-amylase family glycosyl hydrolase [Aggregatilineales bacterium]